MSVHPDIMPFSAFRKKGTEFGTDKNIVVEFELY